MEVTVYTVDGIWIVDWREHICCSRCQPLSLGCGKHIDALLHEGAHYGIASFPVDSPEQRVSGNILYVIIEIAPFAACLCGTQMHRYQ